MLLNATLSVRIRRRWLSVRLLTSRGCLGEYENMACIAVLQSDGAEGEVIAAGEDAALLEGQKGVVVHSAFHHSRVFVSGVDATVRVLRHFIREACRDRWPLVRPRMVLHVQEQMEGGLTDVETVALVRIGLLAGAVSVIISQESGTLNDAEILKLARRSSTVQDRI